MNLFDRLREKGFLEPDKNYDLVFEVDGQIRYFDHIKIDEGLEIPGIANPVIMVLDDLPKEEP